MIVFDVEQNTIEWELLRLGIPTASCFDQIIDPPNYKTKFACWGEKCNVSHTTENGALKCKQGARRAEPYIDQSINRAAGYDTYMNKLLAEWLAGSPLESYESAWMTRGHELESEARDTYEFIKDLALPQVGFVTNDERTAGCSPDVMGLEIKCPAPQTHIQYLLDKKCPRKYLGQVQGCMWICEMDHWDFMSYHPDLPPLILRVQRDEKYIAGLSDEIDKFHEKMNSKKALLEAA